MPSSNPPNIRKRPPKTNNETTKTRTRTKPKTDSDSDSSVEEVIRQPTFYEQLASQHASSNHAPNIQRIKIPLKQKLAQDELIQDFTVEEFDVNGEPKQDGEDDEEEQAATIGDAGQAFFFAIPLMLLLVVFDVLVFIQYREDIDRGEVVLRAFRSFFPIWFIIYATHPRRYWRTTQFGFCVAAIAAGCFLVYSVNVNGYFAVMQRAPPLGTIMIWCVIEMELLPSLMTCAVIGGYTWWKGFSLL